eukprot:m51a1_g2856 hypothetical protein (566) ;mRNA; f:328833-330743
MASEAESKILFRVYLVDGSHKTLFLDPDRTTVDDLWRTMSAKLGIPEDDADCFYIWAVSSDVELLLYAETTLAELMRKWPSLRREYHTDSISDTVTGAIRSALTRTLSLQSTEGAAAGSPKSPKGADLEAPPTPKSLRLAGGGGKGSVRSTSKIELGPVARSYEALGGRPATAGAAGGEAEVFTLVYRPTAVLPIEQEVAARSNEAVNVFYLQAVHDVVCSNYPSTPELALKLAGVQLHVDAGDHNPQAHHAGYLRSTIAQYVPEHLFKKAPADKWEARVLHEHREHVGKDRQLMKKKYLTAVRGWKYYGSTFFRAEFTPTRQSFFHQPFQGEVVIGINRVGVHIIDGKALKSSHPASAVVTCPYGRIVWWDGDQSSFALECVPVSGSASDHGMVFAFRTTQGALISDLIHDWHGEYERAARQAKAIKRALAEGASKQEIEASLRASREALELSQGPGTSASHAGAGGGAAQPPVVLEEVPSVQAPVPQFTSVFTPPPSKGPSPVPPPDAASMPPGSHSIVAGPSPAVARVRGSNELTALTKAAAGSSGGKLSSSPSNDSDSDGF